MLDPTHVAGCALLLPAVRWNTLVGLARIKFGPSRPYIRSIRAASTEIGLGPAISSHGATVRPSI